MVRLNEANFFDCLFSCAQLYYEDLDIWYRVSAKV